MGVFCFIGGMNMNKKIIPYVIYAVVLALAFYLLPLLIRDTGSGMFVLLLVVPVLTFIISLIFGIRQGFSVILPLLVAVLFAPTLFIFYNESAWIYIPYYAVIALIGDTIGKIFHKKQ